MLSRSPRLTQLPCGMRCVQTGVTVEPLCAVNFCGKFLHLPCHGQIDPLYHGIMLGKLMCLPSSARNQVSSSIALPLIETDAPMASELASTHTEASLPLTFQRPLAGSLETTLPTVSSSIERSPGSVVSSSKEVEREFTFLFINPTARRSQLQTGK